MILSTKNPASLLSDAHLKLILEFASEAVSSLPLTTPRSAHTIFIGGVMCGLGVMCPSDWLEWGSRKDVEAILDDIHAALATKIIEGTE